MLQTTGKIGLWLARMWAGGTKTGNKAIFLVWDEAKQAAERFPPRRRLISTP
jgi:hypothetical protein